MHACGAHQILGTICIFPLYNVYIASSKYLLLLTWYIIGANPTNDVEMKCH